jgi:pyruvyl transferase EpsO
MTTSARDTILQLNERIDAVLTPLLPPGTCCALLGFPNYPNVGDSAIWLGTKAWLKRNGLTLVYVSDHRTYARERLARRIGTGVILLNGGGNFGDLYPPVQSFRERVISDFPGNPIIQLPQSICFQRREALERARRVLDAHPRLTLLLRDEHSLEIARRAFQARSLLCPDMAIALGPMSRRGAARHERLWLLRNDQEALPQHRDGLVHREAVDWNTETEQPLRRLVFFLTTQMRAHPRKLAWLDGIITACFDRLARDRLIRGCRLLSQGDTVVTDRLHGHVLSLLLGIRHVVLDNNDGKVKSFYEAWTSRCELACWAGVAEEALQEPLSHGAG